MTYKIYMKNKMYNYKYDAPSIGVYLRPKYRLEITYLLVFNFDQRSVWTKETVVDNAK